MILQEMGGFITGLLFIGSNPPFHQQEMLQSAGSAAIKIRANFKY
jgi:hypothetical protein